MHGPHVTSTVDPIQMALARGASSLPLPEIHDFNQLTRDRWVRAKAAAIPAGSRVLDVGAGTCPYRSAFAHCRYSSHDFKRYKGAKLGGGTEYGEIDYESDVTQIPAPDGSFDVILCTEVLEHVPEPIEALREMARLLVPGGTLLLTAPLGSGLHQLPFHYYGGFTPEWYKLYCERFGLSVQEISPNGGFFRLLAQESARLAGSLAHAPQFAQKHDASLQKLFGDWIPRFLFGLEDQCLVDQFTVGYHVEAVKSPAPMATRGTEESSVAVEGHQSQSGRNEKMGSTTIAGVVFSKDRALQLRAAIESCLTHVKGTASFRLNVLYYASDERHQHQYEELKKEFPSVVFHEERSFRDQLLQILETATHVLFLVDDNVFVKECDLHQVIQALTVTTDAIGFSLRLGKNTRYCYMLNKAQRVPACQEDGDVLTFDWTCAEYDFGYPLEVSSSVYRTSDILPLLEKLEFRNPNTLELVLDANKRLFSESKKHLMCFAQSVAFCIPINTVQTQWQNRAGGIAAYTPAKLAEAFESGMKIDVKQFSGFVPNSCHQETALPIVKASTNGIIQLSQEHPLVSILILTYNGLEHLKKCLASVRRHTPESHEIIVVDNASTDGAKTYLRSVSDIVLIENEVNLGCPPARAQAMAKAQGDFLVFLDNDTVVTKGWLATFLRHASEHPRTGIMGPRSNYVSGVQLVPDVPYKDLRGMDAFADEFCRQHSGELIETPRLVGFCMFIRRDVVDRIGSVDASFGKFGFEDDDYTWRARIAGFSIAIANDVFVHHTGGPQGKGDHQYNQLLFEAWEVFKQKWGLPLYLNYGAPFDIGGILSRQFDRELHYIPLDGTPRKISGSQVPKVKYYSQFHQDRYLDEVIFTGKMGGTFLDIGSHDGVSLSNTYFFESQRGWSGICIEPNPTVFEILRKNRTCTTINGAIAEENGKAIFVKIEGYCEMLSGLKHCFDPRHLERIHEETAQFGGRVREIEVDCFNLNDLLKQQGRTSFDYCNIDVEGAEFEIIKSIDFDAIDIGVLTVENNYDAPEIRDYMKRKGFELVQKLGVDDVFKRVESEVSIEIGGLFTSSILQSNNGQNDAAVQLLLKAKALCANSKRAAGSVKLYDICMRLGNSYLKAEQLQEAREHFEEALREDQYSAEACYGLGLCFQYAGLDDAAREMFEVAVALKPDWEKAQEKALECARVA